MSDMKSKTCNWLYFAVRIRQRRSTIFNFLLSLWSSLLTSQLSMHHLTRFFFPAECSLLPSSIANGFVNGRGSVEGSQYQFSCKPGYSLVGTNTLYCSDQGNWNGSVPSCLIGWSFGLVTRLMGYILHDSFTHCIVLI